MTQKPCSVNFNKMAWN